MFKARATLILFAPLGAKCAGLAMGHQNMALLCECQWSHANVRTGFCFSALLYIPLFQPNETDCYSWHDSRFVTLVRMRPTGPYRGPGISVSRSEAQA
jgi:hypothetical protein